MGAAIGTLEVFVLYLIFSFLMKRNVRDHSHLSKVNPCTYFVISLLSSVVSLAGWAYYATIVGIYWNFVSYLMLTGPFLFIPGYFFNKHYAPKTAMRDAQLNRRVIAAGWVLLIVTLALFTNLPLIPKQVSRHLNAADLVLTPNHTTVLGLKKSFYNKISPDVFNLLPVEDKMLSVDVYIGNVINWKESYSLYKLVGLLTTPEETITRMSGDCQSQAVTTASLLISMGFNAWVVETPFHWWTHAEDPATGQGINLNVHGHAGGLGNVLPQPIDLVYTHPTEACTNCPYMFSHNVNSLLYAAPPPRALAIAWTGAHIFVRSGLTLDAISYLQIVLMGLALGTVLTVHGSFVQFDISFPQVLKRWVIGSVLGIGAIYGMAFWATYLYTATILHLLFVISFSFTLLSTDNL